MKNLMIYGVSAVAACLAVQAQQLESDLVASPGAVTVAPRHAPIIIHERHGKYVTSSNWSGYAVTGPNGSVTEVKASWIIPSVNCSVTRTAYSSFWVGIDGYSSSSVEQIGTDSDCRNGTPSYYVWFEFYPHPSYIVNSLAVSPGDNVSAEVQYVGKTFTVSLTNHTTNHSFSTSTKVNSAHRSSAEWVIEAPWSSGVLPLADFVNVDFGMDYTGLSNTCDATVSGSTGAIGSFGTNVFEITMVTSAGATKSQPSKLSSDGSSFSDAWVSAGP